MEPEISGPGAVRGAGPVAVRSDGEALRTFVIAAGLCWSVLFVTIGLRYQLQMYGDGAIFSYSIAVRDAWAFHWHNISGRLFVYLSSFVPAQTYVALTGDARGGITLYGFSFYSAQLIGLAAAFAADRSHGRIIFSFACVSTVCLCPLVFGFPTEMWIAPALFWPALAVCHYAERGIRGFALIWGAILALVFTHGGALILTSVIMATLALRGMRDAALMRAGRALLLVAPIWAAIHTMFPPDAYFASVFFRAALHFFDVDIVACDLMRLLVGALIAYGLASSSSDDGCRRKLISTRSESSPSLWRPTGCGSIMRSMRRTGTTCERWCCSAPRRSARWRRLMRSTRRASCACRSLSCPT